MARLCSIAARLLVCLKRSLRAAIKHYVHCSISSARSQENTNTLLFLRDELRSKYSPSGNTSELLPLVSPVRGLLDDDRICRLAGDGKYSFTFTGALTIKCASGQRQLKSTSPKAEVNALLDVPICWYLIIFAFHRSSFVPHTHTRSVSQPCKTNDKIAGARWVGAAGR